MTPMLSESVQEHAFAATTAAYTALREMKDTLDAYSTRPGLKIDGIEEYTLVMSLPQASAYTDTRYKQFTVPGKMDKYANAYRLVTGVELLPAGVTVSVGMARDTLLPVALATAANQVEQRRDEVIAANNTAAQQAQAQADLLNPKLNIAGRRRDVVPDASMRRALQPPVETKSSKTPWIIGGLFVAAVGLYAITRSS